MKLKRVYLPAEETDGYRILVDRLWPRGISKEKAKIDLWLKEVAPSNELRKWFGHDPERFNEFTERYKAELQASGALEELRQAIQHYFMRHMTSNITTPSSCKNYSKRNK